MNSQTDSVNRSATSIPVPHRLGSEDAGLTVDFTWQGDRYSHVIGCFDNPRWSSFEGTAEEDWPASAAIQQLSTEVIDGRTTILGVGCCGTTHFSVSVQLEESDDLSPSIRFDWAARLSKPLSPCEVKNADNEEASAWLGSTYRDETGNASTDNSASGVEVETINETTVDHSLGSPNATISIHPPQMAQMRTVQWSYRVRLTASQS
ncbi:hypothetical protein [Aporhodopirellula aestuarii]|uniref:Uncharacterized protein n=1 Tax=Aporhodopirellula aestuarii TaxID=2950107 RepID=A0ABT0U8N6_9BACT|nr:hypothetical protein [Aporhodopirellula aestuarii]MCM2373332.1 hypothetical protein [Aporhodopirellula aestuarii]